MKISKRQLRQIIKEELRRDALSEQLGAFLANLGLGAGKKVLTKGAQKALTSPGAVTAVKAGSKGLKGGGTAVKADRAMGDYRLSDEEREDAAAELALDAASYSWNPWVAASALAGKAAYQPAQQLAKELGDEASLGTTGLTGVSRKKDVEKYVHPMKPKGDTGHFTSVDKAKEDTGIRLSDFNPFSFGEFEEASMSEGRIRFTERQLKRIIREERAKIIYEHRLRARNRR